MTIWRDTNWEDRYKERLSIDVFNFIGKDPKLITYLSDYNYITKKLKASAESHQLDDNSIFVLHICKFFEGILFLIANESGWYVRFNKGKGTSIRKFYLDHRTDIENDIKLQSPQHGQKIIDKLFSTVEDFTERHEAVHYGTLMKVGAIDNYDAILTKARDVVKILLDNGILRI